MKARWARRAASPTRPPPYTSGRSAICFRSSATCRSATSRATCALSSRLFSSGKHGMFVWRLPPASIYVIAAPGQRSRSHQGSIKKLVDLLGAVLDEAVHEGFLASNPARGRRMRIVVRRPVRAALEIDELAALLDATSALDHEARRVLDDGTDLGLTTRLVELHLRRGRRPSQIAAELGLARSTGSWHLRRLGAKPGQGYVARRVVCELLGRAGLRSSELCDLRISDLRLDAPSGAHLRIRTSKTAAGVREVQLSPALVDALRDHLERLRAAGLPDEADTFLVPSTKGTRRDARRLRVFVAAARERANEVRAADGLPPLPEITPHALRGTYVSIALLANGFDVKWVMGQVGHADSRMTLEVYAQLMRRARREHGVNFDRLVREARAEAALLGAGGAGAVRRPRRRASPARRRVCRACGRPHQRARRGRRRRRR